MGYAGCANSVLLAVLLTAAIWSGRLTCVAAEDKCVSGTCSGGVSCLRNLDTTCSLQAGGGCQTTIDAGTVKAECVAACPVTTPAQTTTASTSTAPPTTPDPNGRKRRQAVGSEVTCCTTNMCNRPEENSAAGVFSSMMTIFVSILVLMLSMYI